MEKLEPFIPGGRKGKRWPRSKNRGFMNGVLWGAGSGGRWSNLPGFFGHYETVNGCNYRFIERGVFDAMFAAVSVDADLEWLMIDSTTIRAHQRAAGARS